MNRQELLKYMKAAIDLETDVATQEAIIQACEKKCMEIKPQYQPQQYPTVPREPKMLEYRLNFIGKDADVSSVCFLFGFSSALFVLVGLINTDPVSAILAAAGCSLLCVPFFIKKIHTKTINKKKLSEYEIKMDHYNKETERIAELNQNSENNYNMMLSQWTENTQTSMSLLNNHLSYTKSILEKLYNKDFVYAKYRNLPALTSIYEYFITGRCAELQGAHGAYNMYEDEVRKDTVISQLNTVIEHLEQIKQNQFLLYQQVSLIQKQLRTVEYELYQIRDYASSITQLSALTAYYTALNERNTNAIMACSLMS